MNIKKLKRFIGKVFSGITMFVTFGAFGSLNAQTNGQEKAPVSRVEVASQVDLDLLKQKIRADYRDNIAKYESQSHGGSSGGINT